jgi:hypothetical protein
MNSSRHTPSANDATDDTRAAARQQRVNLTKRQRNRVQELRRLGYTQVFLDPETGGLIPGYADWSLEYVLDEMDNRLPHPGLRRTYYDDLGQAFRDDEDDGPR